MVKDKEGWKDQEAKSRQLIREQIKRSQALRSRDSEFYGLEREFSHHHEQMLIDYERTRDLKHPRDVGDARENLLRTFLRTSGYMPRRYGISERSVRVVSPTGHLSNEIDIAFFDALDAITLMKRQDVYEVYPVESVYGVVQVKSTLNEKELVSALNNLKSFKKLERSPGGGLISLSPRMPSRRGFGILFAYKTNMRWLDICRILEDFARNESRLLLPNAIHILDSGFFVYGDGQKASCLNDEIEKMNALKAHGYPDHGGVGLYSFYNQILESIRNTQVSPPDISKYYQLPLVAEERSYSFTLGIFAEVGHCKKHGDFARKIPREALEKIVKHCKQTNSINAIKANAIAFDWPEDEEACRRQPGHVRIYNPDNLPLSDILTIDADFNGTKVKSVGYDIIDIEGMRVYLPYYYSAKEWELSG